MNSSLAAKKKILTKKKLKQQIFLNKIELLLNFLNNINFGLFLIYDFFDTNERIKLYTQFKNSNFACYRISKKIVKYLFLNSKFKILQNMLNHNILFVYNKNGNLLDQPFLSQIEKFQKLHFFFFLNNSKIYQMTDLKKIIKQYNNIWFQKEFLQKINLPSCNLLQILANPYLKLQYLLRQNVNKK